ncbi:unnamed protein product [Rodentolepis nana]|uniref:Cilia- and flagella-associated protein 36 n=1 Tax=Rodentolepis nana TaxID=102285 RepID=A0A0R3TM19_RODNA|nr:unnamed protein product [Rodentolepis nana]
MESNEREERPNLTSTPIHWQPGANFPSSGNTPTREEENTDQAVEATNLPTGSVHPIQEPQDTCINIHVIMPKISVFREIERSLLLFNSLWRMGFLDKPMFSISMRYLYFDPMLHLLFSDWNSHFVREICDSLFVNTVAMETADFILYFAPPELPLKRVIEEIINKMRADQFLIVALYKYEGGRYYDEHECILDLIWSFYGIYGDEIQKISSRVHCCFINHGRRGLFELDSMICWGCNVAASKKRM